ncbi:hypothetical protein GGS23DRAFT_554240 [Durotheca rogersii]|uniref:uncharacterized protein n=1 Tax=Durotheca rogersii TaxID=419775 RepID=UPI00222075EA|nr:uncharacterized protein GGS23DRAFT_554240 [Durotheca rogersii]KAI5865816.1 hypothetical protein GGS23DRAFT_554240 [Durotheca rogersii]
MSTSERRPATADFRRRRTLWRLAGSQPQTHPTIIALTARNTTGEVSAPTQPTDPGAPEELRPPSSSFEQEQQQTKKDVTRSTPEARIAPYEQQPPQPEEVPRADGSTLPTFRLENPSLSPLAETFSRRDFPGEMVDDIAAVSRSQDETPAGAPLAIVRCPQAGVNPIPKDAEAAGSDTIGTTDSRARSGRMWIGWLSRGRRRSTPGNGRLQHDRFHGCLGLVRCSTLRYYLRHLLRSEERQGNVWPPPFFF